MRSLSTQYPPSPPSPAITVIRYVERDLARQASDSFSENSLNLPHPTTPTTHSTNSSSQSLSSIYDHSFLSPKTDVKTENAEDIPLPTPPSDAHLSLHLSLPLLQTTYRTLSRGSRIYNIQTLGQAATKGASNLPSMGEVTGATENLKLFLSDNHFHQACNDTDRKMEGPSVVSSKDLILFDSTTSTERRTSPRSNGSYETAIAIQKTDPAEATPSIEDSSDDDSSFTTGSSGEVDLTWDEAFEKAKILGEPIIRAARAARARNKGRREDNGCNELLEVLRNGPGTQISSQTYRKLTSPLYAKGVECQPQWSIEPPSSLPDEDYLTDAEDPEINWRKKKMGSVEYISQWEKYESSRQAWPMMAPDSPNGFKLAPERSAHFDYEPKYFQTEVTNPSHYHQHNFGCNWHFTPTISWNQPGWLEWFWGWIVKIPMQANVLDIYHESFFDGTAIPDGGYSLMMQDIEHLPTPRDMSDEETRLHWHETATGLIHNMTHLNEESDVEQEESPKVPKDRDHDEYEKWVEHIKSLWARGSNREVSLKVPNVPIAARKPAVYCRPVKPDDIPQLLPIFTYYAHNSCIGRYGEEFDWNGENGTPQGPELIQRAITKSLESSLPFIVAVMPDNPEKPRREAIVGYALLERVSEYFTDSSTAELQVFVNPQFRRMSIGTVLMDMMLSLADPNYIRKSTCPWVLEPHMDFYPDYQHELITVHCAIPHDWGTVSEYSWISDWLIFFFGFHPAGFLMGLRTKKDDELTVFYLSRRTWQDDNTDDTDESDNHDQ